ncbi:MAG: IclR family transcriptional regulator [Bacilli bacterium]|nr:IclR family transcriptional regulator [Bacilli bacterium]
MPNYGLLDKQMDHKNMVQKTVDVMLFLSKNAQGQNLTEIATGVGIPKTTAYDILKTLKENEIVHYVNTRKKTYGIGCQTYAIGMTYLKTSNLFMVAQPFLIELADKYQKTTFIAKRHGAEFAFVYKYESPFSKVTTANTGDRKPLHCASIGKCFLAFDPDAKDLIDTIPLTAHTKYTITNRDKLRENIKKIIHLGYAFEHRESQEHMACIAAPIYNSENSMIATISMSGLYQEKEDLNSQGEELKQLAKVISTQLGYVENYK